MFQSVHLLGKTWGKRVFFRINAARGWGDGGLEHLTYLGIKSVFSSFPPLFCSFSTSATSSENHFLPRYKDPLFSKQNDQLFFKTE